MGCINCINIKDGKYTTIVATNQLNYETNESRKDYKRSIENIYKKRLFEEKKQTIVTQNIEDFIENNPLPFVKIKRKHIYK